MGIALAQVVIGLWIPITFYIFKRYPTPRAALYCFFAGLMLLPNWVGIKLPMFPAIEKNSVVGLSMLLVALLRPPAGLAPLEGWWWVGTIGLLVSGLLTGFNNPDPIIFPGSGTLLPGHGFKDAAYVALVSAIGPIPISYAGLRMFRKAEDVKMIAKVVTICGLIYSIPALIEVRMSPQFHRWIYGYAGSHGWAQLVRYGGYRPLVLLSHGLVLSLFMLLPTITATTLARLDARVWKVSAKHASIYLAIILVVCKSTGVWIYAALILPVVRWTSSKTMLRITTVLCLVALFYPWLRANEVIPTADLLTKMRNTFGEERAASLEFRFLNEDMLLAKAMLRPWFGWGGYGRNRVFDEYGVDICTTDGQWILTLGNLGLVGTFFDSIFSVGALLIASSRIARVRDRQLRNLMAGIVLACAVLWFDTLPNAPDFLICQFLGAALCSISRNVLAEQERSRYQDPPARGAAPPARPVAARAS